MPSIEQLLANNRSWARHLREAQPEVLERLNSEQHPRHCIIGCSDSRIPVHEMLGVQPGQMFVHRNIANLVSHTDLNGLSVLQYAVEVLHVERVIVCGHYGCGGVTAALHHDSVGLADYWLHELKILADSAHEDLEALPESQRLDRMCELNVMAQVENLSDTAIVRNAWRRGQALYLHGWIFSQQTAEVTELMPARDASYLSAPADSKRNATDVSPA